MSKGYARGSVDKTLFIRKHERHVILVQVYVDDIIFGSNNDSMCNEFVAAMQGEFKMSMMGEITYFLGLQVKQLKQGTFISQSKYYFNLLKKFELENCKEVVTPTTTNYLMDLDEVGQQVDSTKHKGLTGSLLDLITSRPTIQFSVCLYARFQSNLKESHYKDAKGILKYLKGTINVGLWYPSNSKITLSGFSNFDYASCKLDRKIISGTCHLLGSSLISWNRKKASLYGTLHS